MAAEGGRGGSRIPIVPLIVILGIAAVVGLVGYLIWQAGQPAGESFGASQRAEADANPDLPGEFINLPEIYGDGEGYAETANHVSNEVDYEGDQGLPPTGGPHFGSAACGTAPAEAPPFCGPVPGGFYTAPWEAGSLIHNMEHGATVIWYNTEDQDIIDDLRDFGEDNSGENPFLVVAPLLEMEEETVAITMWSRRLIMSTADYDRDMLQDFFDENNCRFDPEDFC